MVETAGLKWLEGGDLLDVKELTIGTVQDMAANAAEASTMSTKTTLHKSITYSEAPIECEKLTIVFECLSELLPGILEDLGRQLEKLCQMGVPKRWRLGQEEWTSSSRCP